jgi:hypothetical protein
MFEPVYLCLQASRTGLIFYSVAAVLSSFILYAYLPYSFGMKLLCIIAVFFYTGWIISKYSLRSLSQAICSIELLSDGCFRLISRSGASIITKMASKPLLYPAFGLLRLKCLDSGRIIALPIFYDAVDKEAYRKMRVTLRIYAHFIKQGAGA